MFFRRYLLSAWCIAQLCSTQLQAGETFCAVNQDSLLTELNETANIILSLIQSNSVTMLIENTPLEEIELILKNFSPTELAFHVDVINYPQPVVAFFYNKSTAEFASIGALLKEQARLFRNKIHFVLIDADQLFKTLSVARVFSFPTLVFYHNQTELARLTGTVEQSSFHEWLTTLFDETQLIQ